MRPIVPRVLGLVTWCPRFDGVGRRHSPPQRPPDIRCHRRATRRGRNPLRALGPTEVCFPAASREERRFSAVQNAFHHLDTRRNRCSSKGLLPPAFVPALPLTPPTLGLPEKTVLFGHCKVTVRSPAGSVTFFREYRSLFYSLGFSCLGLTTQARQRARPTRPSARTDCLARTVPVAAP